MTDSETNGLYTLQLLAGFAKRDATAHLEYLPNSLLAGTRSPSLYSCSTFCMLRHMKQPEKIAQQL